MVKLPTATPLPQLRQMAKGLLAKTKARQVNWARVPNREEPPAYSYQLVLPDSRASFDFITLRFQNAEGEIVDEWRVEEPDHDPDEVGSLEKADPDGDWR